MGMFGHNGWLSKQGKKLKDHEEYLNPIHGITALLAGANHAAETSGFADTVNTGEGSIGYEYNTPIIEPQAEQRMLTTAYNENGGADMFGSNTAYNDETNETKQDKTWLERNENWLIPSIILATTGAGIAYNNYQNKKNNEFNAEQAQINRDYQTEMSNTAHQREMTDLLATGLNPVNTATGGGGASTPAGGAATGVSPAYMDHSSMANTALSLAETMKVLNENKYISKEKKTQIANVAADTVQKNAKTEETQANTEKIKADTENIKKQFELMEISEQQMVLDLATAYVNADNERLKSEIERKFRNTWFGRNVTYAGYTISSILPILGPIGQMSKKGSTININGGNTVNY